MGLTPAQLKAVLKQQAADERSYVPVKGPPSSLLHSFIKSFSADPRTITLGERRLCNVDVTMLFDMDRIGELGLKPEALRNFRRALAHDGDRRLKAAGILVGSRTDIEHEDRVVYTCAKRSAAKIRRFISIWEESE